MVAGVVGIVEDEESIRIGLKDSLEMEGYKVFLASDGEAGIKMITTKRPDVVVLDLMLPKMSGYDVCKKIRERGVDSFIIMLTAKKEEIDRVMGFNAGTDDYMVKPFSIMELLGKIKAIFRRLKKLEKKIEIFRSKALEVDFKKYSATLRGKSLDFSKKEFEILKYFAAHPDEVVSRDDFLEAVWGFETYPSTRTVDNFIVRLRQKLEKDPEHPEVIVSVRGAGYKFCPDVLN